ERVFEQFEQADTEITRKFGGTGLGLSIVLKLVALMGGKIELNSTLGKGTEFVVIIPFRKYVHTTSSKKNGAKKISTDILNGKHILLVEDNQLNQMVAVKFIESVGAKVHVCSSGMDAIDFLS